MLWLFIAIENVLLANMIWLLYLFKCVLCWKLCQFQIELTHHIVNITPQIKRNGVDDFFTADDRQTDRDRAMECSKTNLYLLYVYSYLLPVFGFELLYPSKMFAEELKAEWV